jgi:hypothetical protein
MNEGEESECWKNEGEERRANDGRMRGEKSVKDKK